MAWDGYPRDHRTRLNLLLHIVFVPLFLLGNLALVGAVFQGSWPTAIGGVAAMFVSVAAQGRGHGKEPAPPEPFTGPQNAVSRIFLEPWVTFPGLLAFLLVAGGLYGAVTASPLLQPCLPGRTSKDALPN